jgi:Uma2 family endonuclease
MIETKPMSAELQKWHFNVDQYYRLAEAGVLKPDDRVELIEGEIIKMPPIGSPHASSVTRANYALEPFTRHKFIVSIQNPVRLSDFSEPVPDIALLKPRPDFYAERHPRPEDVLLIIEVADTTLLSDRNVKIPLYARHGIPECWLVNLPKKIIEVYYDLMDEVYRKALKCNREEVLTSPTVPGLSLKVSEIIA